MAYFTIPYLLLFFVTDYTRMGYVSLVLFFVRVDTIRSKDVVGSSPLIAKSEAEGVSEAEAFVSRLHRETDHPTGFGSKDLSDPGLTGTNLVPTTKRY